VFCCFECWKWYLDGRDSREKFECKYNDTKKLLNGTFMYGEWYKEEVRYDVLAILSFRGSFSGWKSEVSAGKGICT
jgi:hypothetical protein